MKTKSDGVTVGESSHPKCPWRVHYRGPNGERKSKFFAKETDARTFAKKRLKEIGEHGSKFAGLEDDERAAVMLWRAVRAEGEVGGVDVPSLHELVRESAERFRNCRLGKTVSEAVEEFLADRRTEGGSQRHLNSLTGRLGRFEDAFGAEAVGSLDADAIRKWLNGLKLTRGEGKVSLTTRDNFRRTLHSFFAFCLGNGWVGENPLAGKAATRRTKAQRLASRRKPGILTPADVERFMNTLAAVRTRKPGSTKAKPVWLKHDFVSFWALKVFAGLRDAEAIAIRWESIDLKRGEIEVPAEISKTGDERTVKIEPALDAWLRPRAKRRGPVAPQSEMTRRYGLKMALRKLRTRPNGRPAKFELPPNWARHSFASYHLYHFRNAGETAIQLGHKGDVAMLHEHYKNPAAERDAGAFWEIRPADPAENVVKFKTA